MRPREVSGAPAVSRDTSSGALRIRGACEDGVRGTTRVFALGETPVRELDSIEGQAGVTCDRTVRVIIAVRA